MLHADNLHLHKEILPFFDFTCNDHAQQKIIELLTVLPLTVQEVKERNDILKGLLHNTEVINAYSYPKIHLNGVYGFISSIIDNTTVLESNYYKFRFQLILSDHDRHIIVPKLIQFINLFYPLRKDCFSVIDKDILPAAFRARVTYIEAFLAHFDLDKFEALVRNGNFQNKDIFDFIQLILKKVNYNEFPVFWDHLFWFEAWLSVAKGVSRHNFSFPSFVDSGFALTDFYHPLLSHPVKNSFATDTNVILITGPNMSGKSTLLKSMSLCVYLAHAGFGVPAAKCELPFFNTISIALNLDDDIISGYSHFMTEVKHLKKIVTGAASTQKCFAVFDEMFKGTNTEDALSILQTTISGLAKFTGSYFFISTHLHQLKDFITAETKRTGIYHLGCNLLGQLPQFTYKLESGWSDLRIGQIIFRQEGLDELLS